MIWKNKLKKEKEKGKKKKKFLDKDQDGRRVRHCAHLLPHIKEKKKTHLHVE